MATGLFVGACRVEDVIGDEGVRLGRQIERAARSLRSSADTEWLMDFSPQKGVDQRYWVGLGEAVWCPNPPCLQNQGGISVHVARGNSGSTTVHHGEVAVPAPLRIEKNGSKTVVVLRRINDTIKVVELR